MSNLKERLDLLREEIQKQDFLQGKGLSNEVNIRIFCYDSSEEMKAIQDKFIVSRNLQGEITSAAISKYLPVTP